MKTPLVSIVVPVYNVEKYLEECFATIVGQTYTNIEVILIDDGSTDSSGIVADRLALSDTRVTVIHKKNGGLSDARNTGMKIAMGEYITFIDSDDYIDNKFIEILLDAALRTGSDIIQCNNTRKPDQLGRGSNKVINMRGDDAFVELMKYKTISPTAWAKLYKLSIFHDNNLDFPVGRLHEDTAVIYKIIYLTNAVVCIDKTLYFYRLNTASIMTASYTKNHYGSVVEYHAELDDFISKNNILIDEPTIHRHKALRFLSILNKMALRRTEDFDIYTNLRKQYVRLSARSYSAVCIVGIAPAYIPAIFRAVRSATPIIRSVLGKT